MFLAAGEDDSPFAEALPMIRRALPARTPVTAHLESGALHGVGLLEVPTPRALLEKFLQRTASR